MKSRTLITTLLVALLTLTGSSGRAEGPNAVITNPGCQDIELPANDDGSTSLVGLPFGLNFFGNAYSSLYVNNNGNVTFNGPLGTYTAFPLLSAMTPIIAPFFADVDTRGAGSGTAHYGSISAGATEVGGHQAFCVNWINVGYYAGHTDKLDSFQLVLVDRADTGAGNFDIMFNYDKVQWESGDASGGSGGLGGSPPRVGYSNGSSASFELAGSAVSGSFLDSNTTTGLIYNDINSPLQLGRYIFPVRNGAATGHSISGHIWANGVGTPVFGAFISACPTPADTACRLTSSSADGSYILNNLPDSTSGGGAVDHDWNLVVNPPNGYGVSGGVAGPIAVNGSDVPGQDVILHGPTPLPPGVSISTPSRGTETSGTPTVYWHDPITLQVTACAGGSGTATLLADDGYSQTIPLVENPSATYTGTFAPPYPHHGNALISWVITCGATTVTGQFNIYIDPSGIVQTTTGAPIAGATVTLFRSDDPGGPFVPVPDGSAIMSPGNQNNPDLTDLTGHFGWDVLAGYYKVSAEKADCTAPGGSPAFVESAVLTIPPPITDLVLQLECAAVCGNGTIDSGEQCDDGNTLDGDCCSSTCQAEVLGNLTCGIGACERTVQTCVNGVPQTCTPGTPSPEVCDGLDNDCNGSVDDGLGTITCGVGECQRTVDTCVGGVPQTCTPGTPSAEVCDGKDNDCNGAVDDGLGTTTCGVGACRRTVDNCAGGVPQTCTPGTPSAEVCDGVDNDCDGVIDNGGVCVEGVPRVIKQQVLTELQALRASAVDKHDIRQLDDAIDHLNKSLDPKVWIDDWHLQTKDGQRAFDEERGAARTLLDLADDKHSSIPAAVLEELSARIRGADRLLASQAIADATATGGDSKKLAEANKRLAKGDSAADDDTAVNEYKEAWKRAMEAIRH